MLRTSIQACGTATDVGKAEAQLVDEHDAAVGVGNKLAHQVLAGDAKMHRALPELHGDLRRREVGDLDAGEAGDAAAVVADAPRLDELEP